MGQHTELMAQEFEISREAQDQLAFESHRKAAKAYDEGFMDDLLVPTAGVFRDNNLRADIDLAKIGALKPAFEKSERGTLTAANSTPLTDGASSVLLASEEWADKHGLRPQAYLVHGYHSAIDFVHGQGLLMAPTIAVSRMLDQAGLTLQDFDFYEIHEAFAAQVLATLKAWESPEYCKEILGKDRPLGSIDRAKLNVKGSSIAFGHPFAATGGRIVATLAQDPGAERRRTRADLDLHGRRHGRRRHHGRRQPDPAYGALIGVIRVLSARGARLSPTARMTAKRVIPDVAKTQANGRARKTGHTRRPSVMMSEPTAAHARHTAWRSRSAHLNAMPWPGRSGATALPSRIVSGSAM